MSQATDTAERIQQDFIAAKSVYSGGKIHVKGMYPKRRDGIILSTAQVDKIRSLKTELINLVRENSTDQALGNLCTREHLDFAMTLIDFNTSNYRYLQRETTNTRHTIDSLLNPPDARQYCGISF